MTERKANRFLLLASGGVLTALTLVFRDLGFLQWLTLVPTGLFLMSEADTPHTRIRGTYGYGFFFFMCYYVVVFHWFIYLYPLDFIDGMTRTAALVVVLAGSVGLSALQAFGGGFIFVAARLILRTRLMTEKKLLRPFALAGLWVVHEWLQTIGWWGVPWGRLPIGQSKYVLGLQTASLFGSYVITFALVAVNMCIAYVLLYRKAVKAMGIAISCIFVFQYGVGALIYLRDVDGEQTVRIAAIQGNIDSGEKWSEDSLDRTLEVYRDQTIAAAEEGADIVLWPESAIPYDLTENSTLGIFCSSLAEYAEVTLLAGAFSPADNEEQRYNSIICILPDGSFHRTVYSKQKLVPFGEFVPFGKLVATVVPPLAELVMLDYDLLFGEEANVIAVDNANIGGLICFDSIYEELTRKSVLNGAQVICLSTNDSWFSDSAALYMHNAQAQLRAIESGRYVVRAANTGISTVINAKGEVMQSLEPLVEGRLVGEVKINTHLTLYSVIGNVLVYFFIIAFVWILLMDSYQKSSKIGKKIRELIDKTKKV